LVGGRGSRAHSQVFQFEKSRGRPEQSIERACLCTALLSQSRAPFAEEVYASAAREILAKQIIMAAKRGERNIRYLSQNALLTAANRVKSRGLMPRPATSMSA
jgi:hypothetical protein